MSEASKSPKLLPSILVDRPAHHSYSVAIITLALRLLQQTNMGLTNCRKALRLIVTMFDDSAKIPCRSSIGNWRDKFGHQTTLQLDFNKSSLWALLVDESITLGGNKILLLLGVDLSQYDFTAPLRFTDIKVLDVGFQPGWKSEQIAQRIRAITQK